MGGTLLGGLGFVMLVWTVNDFFGSMAEYNETAGKLFLLILGLPAVILIGLSVFLPWRRIHHISTGDSGLEEGQPGES